MVKIHKINGDISNTGEKVEMLKNNLITCGKTCSKCVKPLKNQDISFSKKFHMFFLEIKKNLVCFL